MAKANLKAVPELPTHCNPLIGDDAAETIGRAHSVASFLVLSATDLAENGSSAAASDGLTLVIEALIDGLAAAREQLEQEKGGAA